MKVPPDGVLLFGGGIDSAALLVWLRQQGAQVAALWVNYGQKAWVGERSACRWFCDKYGAELRVVSMDLFDVTRGALLVGAEANTTNDPARNKIEARNVVLVGLGAMLAASLGRQAVYVGYHAEPEDAPFPDATEEARQKMHELLGTACRPPVGLFAPFAPYTREEILRAGLKLEPELADRSFTCYESPTLVECGMCAHCERKRRMLTECAVSQ
jgi:7-cyano-7-deazaguanine synthase